MYGGNLYDQFSPITIAQSIFTAATASPAANCTIAAHETDLGHNLEAVTAGQCGFSATHQDLAASTAKLLPLGFYGGPAPTIALALGSPAIGAAGGCRDYTQLGAPLLTRDERGRPRSVPCDVGAFQLQPGEVIAPARSRRPTTTRARSTTRRSGVATAAGTRA